METCEDICPTPPDPGPIRSVPPVEPAYRRELIVAAIRGYEVARALSAFVRPGGWPEGDLADRCVYIAGEIVVGAEKSLIRSILTADDGPDMTPRDFERRPETIIRPARGVIRGGRLYLAIPNPDDAEDHPVGYRDPGGHLELMRLCIVDLANIEDLDAGSPGPGRRRHAGA